jgi:protein-tyrosine phosphatase
MSEIIKNKLFLGDIFDANNIAFLNRNNITDVICVAADAIIRNDDNNDIDIEIHKFNLTDDYECDISQYFDEITQLIDSKNIVLVNCMAGVSRSTTIVLAYLMRYHNLNLKDAFIYVRNKRNQICPNKKFMEYLFEEEQKIFGCNSLSYKEFIKLFYYK